MKPITLLTYRVMMGCACAYFPFLHALEIETFQEPETQVLEKLEVEPSAVIDHLEKRMGLIATDHEDGSSSRCTATLLVMKLESFALTAASCVSKRGERKVREITFVPDFPFSPMAKTNKVGLLPKEWDGKDQRFNYALVHFPWIKLQRKEFPWYTLGYAVLSGLYTQPEGTPLTHQEIQKNRMLFGLYGFHGGLGWPVVMQYLGTLLQDSYTIKDGLWIEGNPYFMERVADFKKRAVDKRTGEFIGRGSPLLCINPPKGVKDNPWVVGLMTDEGRILAITQKMYWQFWQFAEEAYKEAHSKK